jgi:hypothetical protein
MAERRRQGLCYNCDAQYVRGHKCPRLFYLEVSDYDDSDTLLSGSAQDKADHPPLISFSAITGIHHEETMKLHVTIGNHKLTVLLDSGSTHNFISGSAAQHLGLHLQSSLGATVIVADGARISCQGLARDLAFCIGQECFSLDAYTIPLDYYDMVLGISFLKTLGPILWDFGDLCMAFWHHGRRVFWKGIGSDRWDIPSTRRVHSLTQSCTTLLNSFPFALSPATTTFQFLSHSVRQGLFTSAIAVPPYNYRPLQQNKLASQCSILPAQGLTAQPTSTCSAPISISKQQVTWEICVDYYALRDQTVQDTFPTPIVDELLDKFVMPFGLSHAQAKFQNLMTLVLQHFLHTTTVESLLHHEDVFYVGVLPPFHGEQPATQPELLPHHHGRFLHAPECVLRFQL